MKSQPASKMLANHIVYSNRGLFAAARVLLVLPIVAMILSASCLAQTGPQILQITSPADGAVVHPGQTVTITVVPTTGDSLSGVMVGGEGPFGLARAVKSPPYQFSITLPAAQNVPAGKYRVRAVAGRPGQTPGHSPAINLDVEPSQEPAALRVEPKLIEFHKTGDAISIGVWGTFADGSTMALTKSTGITYTSFSTSDFTVSATGVVRAGPMNRKISGTVMIQYGSLRATVAIECNPTTDTTPPSSSSSLSPSPNANGWENTPVGVTLTSADVGAGASGVKQLTYGTSGAQNIASTTVSGITAAFTLSSEGITNVSYFAIDNAGNTETNKTLAVKIDLTLPAIHCGGSDGQWHATDVNLACNANDSLSGLATPNNASFSLSTDVASGTETSNASTGSASICDLAGNCANAGPFSAIMVDKKSPTVNIAVPATGTSVYTLRQAVAASYSCTDGGSGIATCSGPVANGANLDTISPGTKNFTVTGADRVGNSVNASASYVVSYGVCLLYDPTKSVNSGSTIPIKFTLCDAGGSDVSSSSIAVSALNIQLVSPTASTTVVTYTTGSPDSNFRFDASLGSTGGYIYNLSTRGFSTGTYQMTISVTGDPIPHALQFQVHA